MEILREKFFVVGTQRSGTTLLRLILNAHSQIVVPREAFFLMPLLKKKYLHSPISGSTLESFNKYLLSKADITTTHLKTTFVDGGYDKAFSHLAKQEKISLRDLLESVFSSYCKSEGKSIWGNKTPSFFRKIDILHALFPDAKFIHIVRDGRDVFDSFRKIDPSKNNVAIMALDWRYKLSRIERSFKRIPASNRVTIRYEDLLHNGEETVKQVCSVIGVEYESKMLEFYKSSHKNTSSTHSKLIFKPLCEENLNKWKKNLTRREVNIITLLTRGYLKKNKYEVVSNMITITDLLFLLKCLIFGIPMRVKQVLHTKRLLGKGLSSTEKREMICS